MTRRMIIGFIVLMLSGSLWAQHANSMFADRRARQVGDVVTILVVEYAAATSSAKTTSKKENDVGLMGTGGPQAQAYSPIYGLRGQVDNGFNGNAGVERKGQLQTKITATISEMLPNGNFVIQGSRLMDVNGEKETTTITGTIRPEDVSWENTVFSTQVADVQISYQGKGVVNSGQKPGMIAKLFNWIF